jgi:hypothetical protein
VRSVTNVIGWRGYGTVSTKTFEKIII